MRVSAPRPRSPLAARTRSIGCARRRDRSSIVAPALAAMQGLIPTLGAVPPLELVVGRELPPDALAERLVDLGYARADVVEHRGEFAVRGGVVDVFAGDARRPVRLEYLGDEIESLREFSPSTQLSTAKVARVLAPAVRELIPDDDLRALATRRAQLEGDRFRDALQRIGDGLFVEGSGDVRAVPVRSDAHARGAAASWMPGWCSRRRGGRRIAGVRRTKRPRRWPRPRGGPVRTSCIRWTTRSAITCSCTCRSSRRASTWSCRTGGARRGTLRSCRCAWRTYPNRGTGWSSPREGTVRSSACAS